MRVLLMRRGGDLIPPLEQESIIWDSSSGIAKPPEFCEAFGSLDSGWRTTRYPQDTPTVVSLSTSKPFNWVDLVTRAGYRIAVYRLKYSKRTAAVLSSHVLLRTL